MSSEQNMRRVASLRFYNASSGYRGVYWDGSKNRWIAEIGSHRGRRYRRHCRTKEEAARAYDEMAREEYGEFAHLNFPHEGELAALPSRPDPGFCNCGHDLAYYGYTEPGGKVNCRQCNAMAARRYKERKRTQHVDK